MKVLDFMVRVAILAVIAGIMLEGLPVLMS